MPGQDSPQLDDDAFWRRNFFGGLHRHALRRCRQDLTVPASARVGEDGELWLQQLFSGEHLHASGNDRLRVYKEGAVIHEIPLARSSRETLIGRHPDADLQLESFKLGMYHAAIHRHENRVYIENLDSENGLFYNRRRLDYRSPVPLVDGARIDLPGFRLEFTIAGCGQEEAPLPEGGAEQAQQIPACFYTPPPPPASPLLSTLLDDRREVAVWQGGVTQLQVVNIVAETDDCRTFQMRGMEPLLFSYQPGQYVTFLLNIDGREVKRAYSMSSSPSRPYLLEVTVKRVPGGLVSNWLCDRVRTGRPVDRRGALRKIHLQQLSFGQDAVHRRGQRHDAHFIHVPLDRRYRVGCGCEAAGFLQIACRYPVSPGAGTVGGAMRQFPDWLYRDTLFGPARPGFLDRFYRPGQRGDAEAFRPRFAGAGHFHVRPGALRRGRQEDSPATGLRHVPLPQRKFQSGAIRPAAVAEGRAGIAGSVASGEVHPQRNQRCHRRTHHAAGAGRSPRHRSRLQLPGRQL